jgi:hypothetical protein
VAAAALWQNEHRIADAKKKKRDFFFTLLTILIKFLVVSVCFAIRKKRGPGREKGKEKKKGRGGKVQPGRNGLWVDGGWDHGGAEERDLVPQAWARLPTLSESSRCKTTLPTPGAPRLHHSESSRTGSLLIVARRLFLIRAFDVLSLHTRG